MKIFEQSHPKLLIWSKPMLAGNQIPFRGKIGPLSKILSVIFQQFPHQMVAYLSGKKHFCIKIFLVYILNSAIF